MIKQVAALPRDSTARESNGILSIRRPLCVDLNVYLRLPSQFLRFPVGSRLLPRIYADYALWNRATIRILFGFRVKERGREWICESEFLPSLELITRSLRRFIVSLLERSGREREGFLISNFLYLFKRSKWISIREINFFFNFLFIPFEWM